jgi:hypothetical protein
MTRLLVLVGVLAALVLVVGSVRTDSANAHRSRCHQNHTCPSDHATYRWRGLLCVARPPAPITNQSSDWLVRLG